MGYDGWPIPRVVPVQDVRSERHRPHDVVAGFAAIRTSPHYLVANVDAEDIPHPRYTYSVANGFGRDNHFQGVARLPDGKHLAITGGDKKEPEGHLLVVNMASRQAHSSWGTNRISRPQPDPDDTVVSKWALGEEIWHPGGIDTEGNVMAVPLEHHEADSLIHFFDVAEPLRIDRFDLEIVRDAGTLPGRAARARKAAAAGIVTLRGGRVLVVIRVGDGLGFDLYLSHGTGLASGFPATPVAFPDGQVKNTRGNRVVVGGYQSVTLLREQATDRLFLLGAYNTSPAAPLQPGRNRIDLFEIDLDSSPQPVVNGMVRLDRREFPYNGYHNMDAGTTVHVDQRANLHAYCVHHFRSNDRFKLCEFQAPHPVDVPPITSNRHAWIELYDENDFGGSCLAMRGRGGNNIPDYGPVFVNGGSFDDAVASARFQLPAGTEYVLYRRAGYQGASPFRLTGNGAVQEIPSLGPARRRTSSSRFEP